MEDKFSDETSSFVLVSSADVAHDTVSSDIVDTQNEMDLDADSRPDSGMKDPSLDDQVSITIEFSDESNGACFESQNGMNSSREDVSERNYNVEFSQRNINMYAENIQIKTEYSDANPEQNLDGAVMNLNEMFPLSFTGIKQENHDIDDEVDPEEDKIWHCVSCGRCFETKKILDEHLHIHGDNKLYFCTQKTYGVLKPSAIVGNEEIENSGSGTGSHCCLACKEQLKVFSQDRMKELNDEIQTCRFCGKIFDGLDSAHRHEALHKVKDANQVKKCKSTCGNCGRKYSSVGNCYRHVIEMHGGGSFVCPHCKRSLKRHTQALQHVTFHHPRFKPPVLAGSTDSPNLQPTAMNSDSLGSISHKTPISIATVTNPVKIAAPLQVLRSSNKSINARKAKRKRKCLTLRRKRFRVKSNSNYPSIISVRKPVPLLTPNMPPEQANDIPPAPFTPIIQTRSALNKQTKSDIPSEIPSSMSRTSKTPSPTKPSSPFSASPARSDAKTRVDDHVTHSSTLGPPIDALCRRSDNGIVVEFSREIITHIIIRMDDGTMHEEVFRRPM